MLQPEIRNWISVLLGAIIATGYSAADSFRFHHLSTDADLLLLAGGLAALGIHVVSSAVVNLSK